MDLLTPEMSDFVTKLGEKYKGITEIWLFGSRANGTSRSDSDWDLLVFAEDEIFAKLLSDKEMIRDDVDLFVAPIKGETFRRAWKGKRKTLKFDDWKWRRTELNQAVYLERKLIDGEFEETEKNACMVWSGPELRET